MIALSIIIVNYNTKEILRKCLKSLGANADEVPETVEIIVVDNGSTDGSVDYLRELANWRINERKGLRSDEIESEEKLISLLNRRKIVIKLIENKENLGFAKAVNEGIKLAKGENILLLNSDTLVKKGSLINLLNFEKEKYPTVIGARLLNPDGSIQPSCFNLPTVWRAVKEYWLGQKGTFAKFFPKGEKPVEVEAVVGGVMLIPRKIIEKVGLFDERYFMYFEDLDYCHRVRKAGFKIYYLPKSEIIHEHGASGRKLADEKNQWRRLIPSSKIYYGILRHWLITFVIKTSNVLCSNLKENY